MVKLILKFMLFLPILTGMMYFSYRVDPAGLFWGAGFERQAVEYMLDGEYVRGYEKLDGRELNEIYAARVETAPQVLINGSSRVMLMDNTFASGKTFYNAGNTGADIFDIFTGYYIFSKEGKEPEIYLIGIDPWIFNSSEEAIDKRSNKELYYEFLTSQLGYTFTDYVANNPYEKYKALIEPSYFQQSVKYYQNKDTNPAPEIVPKEELLTQNDVIKSPDGSISYGAEFVNRDQGLADFDALTMAVGDMSRLCDYIDLSDDYTEQFETYIYYLLDKNIKVIFYLPPYHPLVYSAMVEQYDRYTGVFKAEDYVIQLGERLNIPVYGSYSPDTCGVTNVDFMDGLHLRRESIRKIIPEI